MAAATLSGSIKPFAHNGANRIRLLCMRFSGLLGRDALLSVSVPAHTNRRLSEILA